MFWTEIALQEQQTIASSLATSQPPNASDNSNIDDTLHFRRALVSVFLYCIS